ncbi:uncharacterized protein LOC123556521 isoform X3 [Mercenaria mercenaria]|uniref:uncharacterized protein LOC123556521 isoform X3 n=1 Tax=Mercenaria mercenaria TaxID=6596 RepID=UPI00234F23FE|nr:uncharacterized protein LOC123556521 isoform X3 [Mercenaria mercenaria]
MPRRRGRAQERSGIDSRVRSRAVSRASEDTQRQRSRSPINGLNMTNPANWTLAMLKEKLKAEGIVLPNSTPHKTLLKLYQQIQNRNSDNVVSSKHETNAQGVVNAMADIPGNLSQLQEEMLKMQATLAELAKGKENSDSDATVPKTSTRRRQISHQSATPMQAIPWLENTVAKLWNAAHENGILAFMTV